MATGQTPGCPSTRGKEEIDPTSVDDITLALARLSIETRADDLPEKAYAAAKMAMLDALGCAFAGHNAPGVQPVVDLTQEWGGREEAILWFHGGKVPAPAAAFVNSVQLHALDFDDYHPPSDAHVTSVLVPAVLAVGELRDASGKETLAALVLGAEVMGRLGRACIARRDHRGFLPTSVVGGFGATAAACRLYGCSTEQTVHAMGIWYAHASGNRQPLFDRTLTKRIQPAIATRAAVFSSCLASRGLTGPRRIVGAQPASLTRIYGYASGEEGSPPTVGEIMAPRSDWAIEELEYKRFACCGVSAQAIKAAISLANEHDLAPEQIEEIRLFGDSTRSPFGGVSWDDHPTPQALAQFCMPYAVASAIRNRRYGPAEIAPARIAEDREVDALARRTQLCDCGDWPGTRLRDGTGIQLLLKDGRKLRASQLGHRRFRSPEDDDEIREKLGSNVELSGLLAEQGTARFLSAIQKLDDCTSAGDFAQTWLAFATGTGAPGPHKGQVEL